MKFNQKLVKSFFFYLVLSLTQCAGFSAAAPAALKLSHAIAHFASTLFNERMKNDKSKSYIPIIIQIHTCRHTCECNERV